MKKEDRTFTIVLIATYSPTSTYDGEPTPVEIPHDMADQLRVNIEHFIERENLLNDVDGVLEIENWHLEVAKDFEVAAYKRGYNWASAHGWVDGE